VLRWVLRWVPRWVLRWVLRWVFKWVPRWVPRWVLRWVPRWVLIRWVLRHVPRWVPSSVPRWVLECKVVVLLDSSKPLAVLEKGKEQIIRSASILTNGDGDDNETRLQAGELSPIHCRFLCFYLQSSRRCTPRQQRSNKMRRYPSGGSGGRWSRAVDDEV